jgi:hypothetical protein
VNSKASITDVNNAISGAGFASASALTTLSSTVGQHTTDITTLIKVPLMDLEASTVLQLMPTEL